MGLNKNIWREAMAQYKAWNAAQFVEEILAAGQKMPAEKWREYQDLFSFGRKIKPQPGKWEQERIAHEWTTYYACIQRFEEWRRRTGKSA